MATVSLATLKALWQAVSDSISTIGSAVTTKAMTIAGTDGTNARVVKTDSGGNTQVVGTVADNAAASGNPVLLAGKYNASPATRDEGDAVTLQTSATGSLLTQLTGRKVQLRDVTADSSTTVNASGGTETITVQATSGYVARLVGFYALAPAVGASGTHKLEVQVGNAYKQSVRAEATFGSASSIQRFYAAGTITPNDVHVIQRNLQNIRFTNAVPLQIVYTNNTDANQTGTRLIRLLLEEEAIVS